MPIPLLPIAVLSLCGIAIIKKTSQKVVSIKPNSVMNGERKAVYDSALRSLREPEKLNRLATVFEGEGLKNEAWALRQRARLRALPPEVKQARRRIFKSAMSSTDLGYIERIASAFEKDYCFDAANQLRNYAQDVRHGQVKLATQETASESA